MTDPVPAAPTVPTSVDGQPVPTPSAPLPAADSPGPPDAPPIITDTGGADGPNVPIPPAGG